MIYTRLTPTSISELETGVLVEWIEEFIFGELVTNKALLVGTA